MDAAGLVSEARSFLRPIGVAGRPRCPRTSRGPDLRARPPRRLLRRDRDRVRRLRRLRTWVVLVPGFVCPDNFWKYLLPELARDHRVIVYDSRGLGLSGLPRRPGYRARNLSPRGLLDPQPCPRHRWRCWTPSARRGRPDRPQHGRPDDPRGVPALPEPDLRAGVADRPVREPDPDVLRTRLHQHLPRRRPVPEAVPAAHRSCCGGRCSWRTRRSRTPSRSWCGRSGRSRSRRTWRPTTGTWPSSIRWS